MKINIDISNDKMLHFLCGFLCALVVSAFSTPYLGFASAVLIGVAKEVYDFFKDGAFDSKDLLATLIGGSMAALYFAIKYVW